MYDEHGNQELLTIAPFQCKQLKTIEVQFCKWDEEFPRVLKYLQNGVKKSRALINMSTFPLKALPDLPLCHHHCDQELGSTSP
jgi:hypothetical protein